MVLSAVMKKNKKLKVNIDLSDKQISDEALKNILPNLQLVSSKQLAKILTKRNDKEINEIVDKFYNLYIEEVSNNPEGHAMDYVHVIMDIEKI